MGFGPLRPLSVSFPRQRAEILTWVFQIVRKVTNVNKYLIFTAALPFLRYNMLFFLLFLLLIASPDYGRTEAANTSFYLGIGRCYRMRSSQSGSLILLGEAAQMGKHPQGLGFRVYNWWFSKFCLEYVWDRN